MTHICVGNLTIIGSDNGLSPGRRQAIVWNNAGILLIGPLETNFSEILIGIRKFSFTKMHLKMSSAKWRPFSLGLNVFKQHCILDMDTQLCAQPSNHLWFSVMFSIIKWFPRGICAIYTPDEQLNFLSYHTIGNSFSLILKNWEKSNLWKFGSS